ncbi:D-2-hydroxyglutarate dehydrogenase, mitochondrial-like [Sitodiplosis mosellana]|uniref:D-2-hydroxyglutarate dehydrogenase, mitochondrial-like n=1 Tax=Sitodiplosis mosellana TaxID=263140 RepID=UPI00244516B1|nr:D-2-hydroxyglutarate dehydrogenase, mitochondrial-like [Sitodiplosis mosellana]XP_055320847.1 D-2-hydroxyglutarate dehydrogenase, mitochondrial-like [Sitodiplosis mosellana]
MLRQITILKQIGRMSFAPLACNHATRIVPDLTKDRYSVKRGDYGTLTNDDIKYFESILSDRCITDKHDIEAHNIDFYYCYRGSSQLLLKPRTTEEVSVILKHCNARKLAVCPQGGNTGLVAGTTPIFDEIILSMQLMNKVEHVDETSGILVCQSGCVLEKLEERVLRHNLVIPIDLGAKGSCHIGGNVSTNAGGLRLLRYGNLHGNVLGIEAVKADGTILDLMSNFKKDNTGYHLKHLFIGSEGTLGVVTKLAIACPTASKAVNVAFLGLNSFEDVLKTFTAAKRDLGEILSACEMMDHQSLRICVDHYKLKSPVGEYPFYLLLETSGSNIKHDEEKMSNFLESSLSRGDIQDGTVTSDPSKVAHIWSIRELLPTAKINEKYFFKYDISVPISRFYEIVEVMRERLGYLVYDVQGFGHMGDSNLHINVLCDEYSEEIEKRIEPFIYEYAAKLKGSISAEHGIGFQKREYLKTFKQPEALHLMKELKLVMDPNRILNPYKVLCD